MNDYKTYKMVGYANGIDVILNEFSIYDPRIKNDETVEIFRTLNFRCFENQRNMKRYFLSY